MAQFKVKDSSLDFEGYVEEERRVVCDRGIMLSSFINNGCTWFCFNGLAVYLFTIRKGLTFYRGEYKRALRRDWDEV